MSLSLKQQWPFRLIIGTTDATQLLDDSFSFSSTDPGGFEAASFQIPKDMPSTLRGTYVRLDCGLGVAWEGRVKEVQRSLGNKTAIQCEGYGALLKDNAASMVFVDRDLTQWQSPSTTRQVALAAVSLQLGSSQVAADPTNNLPALAQVITDSWVSPYKPVCEAWYDSGPENLLAAVYYNVIASGGGVAPYNGAWADTISLSSDAVGTTVEGSANLFAGAGSAGYFTPATPHRYAVLSHNDATTPDGVQGATFASYWRNLTAYGNHGLTGRGADPVGFYPSDIAGWAIDQVPSGLQAGVMPLTDATGYIMPHSVYYTPVGLDQIIGDMATAAGWHWGAWPSLSPLTGNPTPRCDFRPRPPLGNFSAFCLRRDTTLCDVREDLGQQFNKAIVTYSNVDGSNGAVSVTMDNPILDQAGIPGRTMILNGGTMTAATASLFGQVALAYTFNEARVAGSVTIEQAIGGPSGPTPAWMLKPGIDRLRVGDLPSFDAWGAYSDVPLSRMEMSGSSSGFSTSLEVGVGASLVETLQARLAAATALAGVGG